MYTWTGAAGWLVGVGAVAFVVACANDEGVPHTDANVIAPTALMLTATDVGFEAPDTLPSGFVAVRLTNRGTGPHLATLVRLDSGKTLAEYVHAYREANRTRSERPGWARFLGGPGALGPEGAGTATMRLEPGQYAWVCFVPGPDGKAHLLTHNQAHALVVRPASATTQARAPEATASVGMTEYGLDVSTPLKAGKHVIRIENKGVEPHHALFFRLAPGKTTEDFQTWMQHGMQGEAPSTLVGAMAELSGNTEAFLEVDLPPGEYVVVCLVAGRDEVPHMAKGMIKHFHIE
jgi:hypothetical protein